MNKVTYNLGVFGLVLLAMAGLWVNSQPLPSVKAATSAPVASKLAPLPAIQTEFSPVATSGKVEPSCKWQLVYYTNPHCSACQRIEPLLAQWETELPQKVKVSWVNVGEESHWPQARARGIRFTPSFILYTPQGQPHLDMTRQLDVSYLNTVLRQLPVVQKAC